jgi:DNA polymerase-3 subunit beta
MKFTITREALLPALHRVAGVIERRQTLPILSNVHLELAEGELSLTGTDLEVQLRARVAVESGEPGTSTVPARKLLDICRLLPDRSLISLEVKDSRCTVKSGSSRYNLSTLPSDQYPGFDQGTPQLSVDIPAASLRRALDKTTFATAKNDVRYYLNGLLLDLYGDSLRTVGSDGHRLALYEEACSAVSARQAIIPGKGVQELGRLLEGVETLALEFSLNTLRASAGAFTFATKLIDGRFPDYRRVMPNGLPRGFRVDIATFRAALARAALLSNEKYKAISLEAKDGTVVIKAQNPESEEAEERIEADMLASKSIHIGFNVDYLIDAIEHLDSAKAVLKFTADDKACVVEAPEPDGYRCVVMPMRL